MRAGCGDSSDRLSSRVSALKLVPGPLVAVVTGDVVLPSAIPTLGAAFSLLSAMFLHADFWHLAGNMMLLWLLGELIAAEPA